MQGWRELNTKIGISLTFGEAFRTTTEQKTLEEEKGDVAAKAGTSLHEASRAKVSRWRKKGLMGQIVDNAKAVGISWGNSFGEPWHFFREVPGGRVNRSKYIQRAQ